MKQSKPIPVIAVFDIGKTNKKFLLFDQNYSVVDKQQSALEQTEDEDGYPCEDLNLLASWVKDKFNSVIKNKNFSVNGLNFSAYGASLVHLNRHGETVTPLYNYLKSYPKDLLQKFYNAYGGKEQFSLQTASPPMGMLNSGLQLYWLKHRHPSLFEKIHRSLHFPQYLSYLFTGNCVTECTSIGCHTALWNYERNKYHRWVEDEEIQGLFPPEKSVVDTQKVSYKKTEFKTGIGIHDSSAALAPYLYAFDEPFLLVSTGTWSITLNPFNTDPLTFEELKRDCLCYLNVFGDQVKASRLFLGNEYSHQKQKLDRYFGREKTQANIQPDIPLLRSLIKENCSDKKLILETAHESGPYPQEEPGRWSLDVFQSYEEACHQLMLDLVSIQADCIELAQGSDSIDKLIITGGFSQNELFVKLLASRFPNKEVYTASLTHASALGAALVIDIDRIVDKAALKGLLGLHQHSPIKSLNFNDYTWKNSVSI